MFYPYLIFTKKLLYAYGFDDLINVASFQTTVVRTTVEKLHGDQKEVHKTGEYCTNGARYLYSRVDTTEISSPPHHVTTVESLLLSVGDPTTTVTCVTVYSNRYSCQGSGYRYLLTTPKTELRLTGTHYLR